MMRDALRRFRAPRAQPETLLRHFLRQVASRRLSRAESGQQPLGELT